MLVTNEKMYNEKALALPIMNLQNYLFLRASVSS